jgi:hypothetical protein
MDPALSFYSEHGPVSDPGEFAHLFEDLPTSLKDLVQLVRGITVHVLWADRYALKVPQDRLGELQLRSVERRLERTLELDPRPLIHFRSMDKRLLGNCRDHSLLLAALLRHQGIPARTRCGFATYFMPDHYEDHWVTEYWNEAQQRWVLVDSQLDMIQCKILDIQFDTLDVPRDQYIVAGKAWQMCRSGRVHPDKFGILGMKGLGFVRGNLVRDVAALNKMELLPWDCWGVILNDQLDCPDDTCMLDELAALTAADCPNIAAVRARYDTDPRLHVGAAFSSYVNGGMVVARVA